MSLAIMQPYFFPYIGYFQLIDASDIFVLYDDVNYIKQGWIHRNRILINGKPSYFGPQLIKPSQNKKINEVLLNNTDWKKKLLTKIKLTYSKKKFFNDTFPLIQKIILSNENITISDLNKTCIIEICNYLDINKKIITSSEYFAKNTGLKKEDRIINICKQLNQPTYINAIGGQKLYTKEMFENYGISLYFIKNEIKDTNMNLSIVDILMNYCKKDIQKFIKQYSLV